MGEMSENMQRMLSGELYTAFTAELIQVREKTARKLGAFNDNRDVSRRRQVELWRDIAEDKRPMPPVLADEEADAAQFEATDAWVLPPLRADYGWNIKVAAGALVNYGATFIDTMPITIGARTMLGPNCSLYSGTHPLDPAVRNGLAGPETGKAIVIGEDCWLGGGVHVLPGVTIGRGATVGAASVVTRDVPPFTVVAGNPARVIRKIETAMDPEQAGKQQQQPTSQDQKHGAEVPAATLAAALPPLASSVSKPR